MSGTKTAITALKITKIILSRLSQRLVSRQIWFYVSIYKKTTHTPFGSVVYYLTEGNMYRAEGNPSRKKIYARQAVKYFNLRKIKKGGQKKRSLRD
ncbi:MAG TPA: hypothetical protein GX745_08250 [Clostridiales bacterium]|nr:hypothetical protein [Clostridiales bacterium]